MGIEDFSTGVFYDSTLQGESFGGPKERIIYEDNIPIGSESASRNKFFYLNGEICTMDEKGRIYQCIVIMNVIMVLTPPK